MKNNNFFSLLLVSVFLINSIPLSLFADDVPKLSTNFNYNDDFPTTEDENLSKSGGLVGDDNISKKSSDQTLEYVNNTGNKLIGKYTDKNGNSHYINIESNKTIDYVGEKKYSKEYMDALNKYNQVESDPNATDEEKTIALDNLKKVRNQEMYNQGYTVANFSSMLQPKNDPSAMTEGVLSQKFFTKTDGVDENITNLYKNGFGYQPRLATKDFVMSSNAGKLKAMYSVLNTVEQQQKQRMGSSEIKCFISRKLMPAFYCPFPDMTGTVYPDFSNPNGDPYKVSSAEAEKTCNQVCYKKRSCVSKQTIKQADINITDTINLYPADNYPISYTIPVDNKMQVKTVEFDAQVDLTKEGIEFLKEQNLTENNWLRTSNEKLVYNTFLSRYITKLEGTGVNPNKSLYARERTYILGSTIHKVYYIGGGTQDKLIFSFYKPYFKGSSIYSSIQNDKLFKYIKDIKIKNIQLHYTSKNLYFCTVRQLVDNQYQCKVPILDVKNGISVLHVCTDGDHKIGPDETTGGFYSKENCENACVEYKKCLPTYRHYSNITAHQLYKAQVGCIDSPDNGACTKKLCESYFANGNLRPVNEIVIQNDNTRVFTIKNKVLTDVPRPKIDYNTEINSVDTDYKSAFQTEMKDNAYKSMIENQNFNRVHYPIGIASPTKKAIQINVIDGKKQAIALLKPNSFNIDNGKNYYIYAVIKFTQIFRPAYGLFTVDGHTINATTQPIEFKDTTYIIKEPNNGWKTFRQILFSKVKKNVKQLICKDEKGNETEKPYTEGQEIPENCLLQTSVIWSDIPAYKKDRNVFYNPTNDTFANYDMNEKADFFKEQQFSSDQIINTYKLTDDIFKTLVTTPGAVFRSQLPANNGETFVRKYNTNVVESQRSYPDNVWIYLFYSDHPLTYQELYTKLEPNAGNVIWELGNPSLYPTSIQQDGEINNNIKVFIAGNPDKTTVEADINPKITERGERVFKFLFLYNFGEDPFNEVKK